MIKEIWPSLVYGACLENKRGESSHEFESHSFLQMNTEVRKILGSLIVAMEDRISQVYNIIQASPNNLENDKILIQLFDQLTNNLEEYK